MHLGKQRIVALTQGRSIPSTRFRWQQYVEDLRSARFDISELTSGFGAYAPRSLAKRSVWLGAALVESLVRTLRAGQYDLCFLQRNLIATLCTWEPLLRRPFVFDVDDAIFLGPRGANANRIARSASLIICGNNFLAEHFSSCGPVAVLPTAVDTLRFFPKTVKTSSRKIIGWSGSSSGFKYLYGIESAIVKLLEKHPTAVLKIMADKPPIFRKLPNSRIIYEPWSPGREVDALQDFTVGIMPLEDDPWARGKCSFKMLTYMAVGVPVVVSPVGMNVEILSRGVCGLAARSDDDWVDAISALLNSDGLADEMGRTGKQLVDAYYSRKIVAPQLARLLASQI